MTGLNPRIGSFLTGFIFVVVVCGFSSLRAQIILSEVMFDADTLEQHNEFVEIYNPGSDAVNLAQWQIGDSLELDQILDTGQGNILAPQQYAVILDGSYFGNSTTYDTLIPPEALILKIDDGSFGQYGWSNSHSEPVILVNAAGDTVQKYYYSLGNEPGYSDEKIMLIDENSMENWADSRSFRGTPGGLNSVSPAERDLAIDSAWVVPEYPVEEANFYAYVMIRNAGTSATNNFTLIIFDDLNKNRTADSSEILVTDEHSEVLLFQDTLRIQNELPALSAGNHALGFALKYAGEQRPDDNSLVIRINVESVETPLVINEILYRPRPGYLEWVEVFNRGQYSLNINQWKFADARDTVIIPAGSTLVEPGEYYLLAKDSVVIMQYGIPVEKCFIVPGFPTLNNDADDVKLLSLSGRLIDRVTYSDSWMGRKTEAGVSLERINPTVSSQVAENWSASVDPGGSTPARKNSLFVEKTELISTLSFSPNPFSPDGDGYEDFTLLQYKLPIQTGFMTVDIFDLLGRRVRRLADYIPVGQQGSLLWDGKNGSGKVCRMGMYVVLIQIFQGERKLYKQYKNTVVLVKK